MEELFGIWAMAMTTGAIIWIGRSLSLHWKRKHEARMHRAAGPVSMIDELMARIRVLEGRDDDLVSMERRVFDLEERLDFTERALAQHRPPPELPSER